MGAYGLVTGAWVLVAGEGAFALGSLTVVVRVLPGRRAVGSVAGCAVLVVGTYAVLGSGPGLLVATAGSLAVRVTQIRACVRSRTAAGVSVPTWLLLAAANGAWAASGVLRSDPVFAWSGAAGGAASLAVAATGVVVSQAGTRRIR